MIIEINKEYKIDVKEDYLTVNDKRLYNTNTKQFEGIDGDIIHFEITKNGSKYIVSGMVEGYTCGGNIKLRGSEKEYSNAENIRIDKISSITDYIEKTCIIAEPVII